MRNINKIIIHCAYTPPSMDIGTTMIRNWHVNGNGWSDIGYHFVINRAGELEPGRPIEQAGAHVKRHNAHSIGVCLVGGKAEGENADDCNYTKEQWKMLSILVNALKNDYPDAEVLGHRDLDKDKTCPVFDVKEWWNENRN